MQTTETPVVRPRPASAPANPAASATASPAASAPANPAANATAMIWQTAFRIFRSRLPLIIKIRRP
ncbi:MAG: hypothetical protein DBX93_07445 [Oscillospiraceae bacterium]|nr:MAG: hypothetical protein DBX93_07445 [Oscillospiraceae bacterium]